MSEPIAWINGHVVPVSHARLHVFDMGVVGGVSVAEMLRTFCHRPFRVEEHLRRLDQSLLLTGLQPAFHHEELAARLDQVVSFNTSLIKPEDDLGIVVFVTAGMNPTYVGRQSAMAMGCTVGIHTFPLPYQQWAEKYREGVSLVVPAVKAMPVDVVDPRIKSRSRMHWHLANQAARQIEPGALAMMMDEHDHLTETAAANLIAVIDGELVSPPAGGVLEGVSLGVAVELAAKIGRAVHRRPISVTDLARASEAFLTSTPSCLLPVTRFQRQPLGSGQPGPIYQHLLSAWNEFVGMDIAVQMQRDS
jgi:branched-subunit amino acid aminotransferase/4-amino-4-deoxychorismate lyase